MTGRVAGFSIGALTAATASEDAEIAGVNSVGHREQTVEPMTGYTVLRARKEFQNQSSLGFMTTSTNRQLDTDVSFLPANAYAGGVDYDWRLSQMYSISGYFAGSHIAGNTDAIRRLQENNVHGFQRPDADYMGVDGDATSLQGHAGSVSFGKISGESTRFSSYVGYKSPGFDTNDLGFMRRADERNQSNWFQWRNFKPGKYVRTRNFNINQYAGWNFGGDRTYSGGNINSHWTFANYYSVGGGFNVDAAPFRDRVTRGGPGVLGNPEKNLWYYANTDNRKALSFYYNGGHWADSRNSARHDINPGVNWRRDLVDVAQSRPALLHQPRRLAVGGERRPRRRRAALCVRTHRPEDRGVQHPLQLHDDAQPVVAGVCGAVLSAPASTRTTRSSWTAVPTKYEDRYRPYAYGSSADFNIRSFRTTNVLRWEYRPGIAALPGLAAGQVRRPGLRRFPLRTRLRRRLFRPIAQRLPDQVQLLAEYVGQQADTPAGQQENLLIAGLLAR